ncbi:MaoC family dehydratase [Microvirga arabica]|uniref:MaoC family dehydratase n=1 Tax=Microvirga arabica TaxID=1128671 RepID=UPI001939EF3F|nr:MaoC family dehydratase [Microvirga arabica]MBM1171150.1 MaoC family dehydratase [Microvirga arabica]
MNVHAPLSVPIDELKNRVGQEVGVSSWKVIDQDRIDRFAAVTEDLQFIHIDPERALAETPFGGTIAHGFLTLSLLSAMGQEALPVLRNRTMGINYGLERVRFLSPVAVEARVRGRFTLSEVSMRSDTQAMLRYQVTVEIEGAEKPALAAEWITLAVLG